MNTINNCEGCPFNDDCDYTKKRSDECPCRQCIVKVTCVTVCDEYLLFTGRPEYLLFTGRPGLMTSKIKE